MKRIVLIGQIAMIFIGSIVGAGVCSGRELNQFFSTYGIAGFGGIVLCGLLYIVFSKIIVEISMKKNVSSYNEFVDLVCPKYVAKFINIVLTLFLLSSTSIILAGSGALIEQYFNVPKWVGIVIMIGCSSIFLMRNTEGLFEVNTIVVPTLITIMTAIFISYVHQNPFSLQYDYMRFIPAQKEHLVVSTLIYVSFNILTIIGVIVPLTNEIRRPKEIQIGIIVGSGVLTVISMYIIFLMLVNPFYPKLYEMPLLAIAMQMSRILKVAMLGVMWLEMFSSQVSNVYSLSYFLRNKFNIAYKKGIFLVVAIAIPFSGIGFAKLVEILYPMYGILSLTFLMYCLIYYYKLRKEEKDMCQLENRRAQT